MGIIWNIAKIICSKGPVSRASAQCTGYGGNVVERPGALTRYFTVHIILNNQTYVSTAPMGCSSRPRNGHIASEAANK